MTTASEQATSTDADTLRLALSQPVANLQARAGGDDPAAAHALSLLTRHGLRDVAADPERADALARQARAATGRMTAITQYTAGLNGAPGRVNIINVPLPGLSAGALSRAELCAATLQETNTPPSDADLYAEPNAEGVLACGGPDRFHRLLEIWGGAATWRPQRRPDCDRDDARCQVLARKIGRLNARDPGAEARAAAARGDFKLGAFNHIGPMPQGWRLPGVECRAWARDMIGAWHVNQDVILPGDGEHSRASIGFIAAYNRAMIGDPAFPYADICAEPLVETRVRYAGPVTDWPQYARARDVAGIVPTGRDIDERDGFGKTALQWAMANDDEPMALTLLAAGADADLPTERDTPSPLVLAVHRDRAELAQALMDGGARMTGSTGLCDDRELGFVFVGAGDGEPRPDLCSWAGLLITKRRFDDLDAAMRGGGDGVDGGGGTWSHFFAGLEAGDEELVRRVAPHMKGAGALQRVWKAGRTDLALIMVSNGAHAIARSDTEKRLWRAAAGAGRTEALAFLYDYGGDVNLLTAARAADCERAAAGGDMETLLACVTEAGQHRMALIGMLDGGRLNDFRQAVADVSDVREDAKPSLLKRAASKADAATVRALLERGAKPYREVAFLDGGDPVPARAYSGALRDRAEAQATATGYWDAMTRVDNETPTAAAVKRGDVAMVRALVEGGARDLRTIALWQGGMSGVPPGSFMEESRDVSALPGRPPPPQMAVLTLVVPEMGRAPTAQADLEDVFAHAVTFGYDDVLRLVVEAGYDPRRAERPDRLWSNWATLGNSCKPSTGRLLAQYGVDARYPLDPARNGWWPQKIVAAGCRNPDSAAVLIEAGLAQINELDERGETVLDEVLARPYRPMMQVALRALGGKTGAEVDPEGYNRRRSEARVDGDLDLVQSEQE